MAEVKKKKEPEVHLTPRHVIAARGLLGMSQEDLVAATGLSMTAIQSFENARVVTRESTRERIRTALTNRGIVFTNGNTPGVMLDPARAIIPTR